ncbi:MAG TPA: hypothetical protein VF988_03180 [Verrucomicrobiae bacterium]
MQNKAVFRLLAAIFVFAVTLRVSAQGTAISYQGRLYDGGAPANTNYDLRFAVYDALTNGLRISAFLTNSAVPVSNGLFAVTLDFGPNIFNGTDNGSNDWMDIAVRATGTGSFTALTPRQPILPVPYALFAVNASNLLGKLQATQLVGTISSAVFAGSYSNVVNFVNSTNTFAGTFSGNGAGLTNLNGSNISQGTVADARLSGNVALLNANQTFTGANIYNGSSTLNGAATLNGLTTINGSNTVTGAGTFTGTNFFTGINSFTNLANSFSGNFYGNGLVGWLGTNSTAFTSVFDHGYLVTNATTPATVTLPASANIRPGDIVRIAGGGAGGWFARCNAGQTIIGNFASYSNGTLAQISSSDCYGVTASGDGARLYDSTYSAAINNIYYTTDHGQNWPSATGISGSFNFLACSANGKIVYAESIVNGGPIVKSFDGGLSWPSTNGTADGTRISCTADGSTLLTGNVACTGSGVFRARVSSGVVQISNNSGSTWANVATAPAAGVTCVGCSSDCTKLVAAVSGGRLYVSSNQGSSWMAVTSANQLWSSVWMSADGSKFAGAINTSGGGSGGVFYCDVSAFPNTSTISGGAIGGSLGSSVELQYIGNGQFMPVSSTGLIWAN